MESNGDDSGPSNGNQNSDENDSSSVSDINVGENSGDSFPSDTDSDDEVVGDTQSSLGTYSSEMSDPEEEEFWSTNLTSVSIAAFEEETGPNHNLSPTDSVLQYFFLMISDDFFNLLAVETNRYADQVFARKGRRDPDWSPTNKREVQAYFGLHIFMGIHKLPSIDMYWSQNRFVGIPGFKDTMPRCRFQKLTQFLHMSNNEDHVPTGTSGHDRLFKIRPLIDLTRKNFQRYNRPGKCQSIDEGMIRYKGNYFAKQYTPCKPIKRGLKVWMRCEPNGYTHDYRIYLEKHDDMKGQTLGETVVKHLCKPLKWKGHHVFFDRFFTSIPFLQNLENNGIYACGTIMSNRRGFPADLKNPSFTGRGDAEQRQHENLVATAWKDAKPVHIVSTTSDPLGDGPTYLRVPGGGHVLIQRPPAVAHYQENYFGVDRAMQYRAKCPVGRQSRKYWKYFMNFILDMKWIYPVITIFITLTDGQTLISNTECPALDELVRVNAKNTNAMRKEIEELRKEQERLFNELSLQIDWLKSILLQSNGDFSIIKDRQLRGLLKKGPKYRIQSKIDFIKCREVLKEALDTYTKRWCK
ncbi:hypothetical protein FSP39_025359 [Pinctada imbricata]|uniref:PiggyBac transposable element-derived protein domain-containing protein n=1 Tax=Pinctada imbricata TaxID=66713 RepID=A0AA88YNY9_PINIB|nr:hypothetical protein FSP39_025359 [Pinctada imbricata]